MSTCYNPFTLVGKTILVTGASSGIGKATAIECARLGAKLIITGRNEERLAETKVQLSGDDHVAIAADLCDDTGLKTLVKSLPCLDGIVSCAGINETIPTAFCTPKKFGKIFETNFFATVELVRNIQKSKKLNPSASIVFISSAGGNYAINIGNGIYGASKAALSTWVKFLAQELGGKGIRVNAICPGMVDTPLIHSGAISEEQLNADMEQYALKRFGRPEEIAYACVYFLSDASAWVTGTNFLIDGGYSLK